jgi:hypothetical protein
MPYLGNTPTEVPLSSADLQDGIITSAKIANGTITTADLASGVGGKVLQVVSATKTDSFSVSSATFTDVTGLSVSITPSSASNKILILASISGSQDVGVNDVFFGLVRGATQIALGDSASSRVRASMQFSTNDGGWQNNGSINHLDSPSTTSSTTYKIQCRQGVSGSVFVNRSKADTDSGSISRTVSTITAIEIAP